MTWLGSTISMYRLSNRAFVKRVGIALTGGVMPVVLGAFVSTELRGGAPIAGTPPELYILTGFVGFCLFFVVYNLVNAVTSRRDALIYQRLRCTPLPESSIFAGEGLCAAIISIGGAILLTGYGVVAFGSERPHNIPLMLVGVLLGVAMFIALAIGISGVLPGAETSIWIVTPLMVAFMAVSGVFLPMAQLPAVLSDIAPYLPLSPIVEIIRTGYLGQDFASHPDVLLPTGPVGIWAGFRACLTPIAVILAWTGIGIGLAGRLFRWNPRRGC
jgi:ABC-2 type transport system permease protein